MKRFNPTPDKKTVKLHQGTVLTVEPKIATSGEPYVQFKVTAVVSKNNCIQPGSLFCNHFFRFEENDSFDEKMKTVAAFAKNYAPGKKCYYTRGSFIGYDNQRHACIAEVYASVDEACTSSPNVSFRISE